MDTKALRQKVLDLAIRGKLVPQDPNDEPASVLLERIRQQKQQMVRDGKLKAKDIKNDTIIFIGEDNLHYEKFADGSVRCIDDEIPFDLPDGWAWERLSNLAVFSGGKTPSTSRSEYWDGDVLWVTSKDMKSKYITSSQLRLSALGAAQMQIYQPDTLLLVTRSGILRHTLPVAVLKECATINQDLKAIVLYMPQLAEYIYVCLKGMEAQLLLKYTKSGTTVENVNFDEFQKVLLPIPPVQQIDRIISATGDAECVVSTIEDDKAALAGYVARAKAKILDLAIRGQLVPQDPTDEPASALLERIRAEKEELIRQCKTKRDRKESVIFRGEDNSYYEKIGSEIRCIDSEIPFDIPDGWTYERLGNICSVARGGSPRPIENYLTNDENGLNWIKIGDTEQGGKYIFSTKEKIRPDGLNKTRYVHCGDFLLTNSMSFGRPYILKTDGCIHDGWLVIGDVETVFYQDFLYYMLSSPAMYNALSSLAVGSTVKNLKSDSVKSLIVPIPPIEEQKLIADRVEMLFTVASQMEKSLS